MPSWPLRLFLIAIASLALVALALVLSFRHDMAEARARLVGKSLVAETPFGPVEYAQQGQGQPLLLIHGAAGGFDQSIDLLGDLAGSGYELIAPSRFGYLRSPAPKDASPDTQADAFAALLDQLGQRKVVLIAVSAGAWSALSFARRYPDRCRAMILIVPGGFLPDGVAIEGGAITEAIIRSDFVAWAVTKFAGVLPATFTETMLGTPRAVIKASSADEQARLALLMKHLLPMSERLEGMELDVATAANRHAEDFGQITCKVLAISAEDDPFHTADRARFLASQIKGTETLIFPTGGHGLAGHFPDARAAILTFLNALPGENG